MKKSLLILSTAILVACSSGGDKKRTSAFELKGTLANANGETLYLEKLDSQKPLKVDSCIVGEDGTFSFENYSPEISFYRIKLNDQNFAVLVFDSLDKVKVTADAKQLGSSYKVEGSPETKLFLEYSGLMKANRLQTDSMGQAYQMAMQSVKMDSLRMDSLSKIFEGPYKALMDAFSKVISDKVMANTDKYASLMALQPLDPEKYSETYKALDEGLNKRFPGLASISMFHQMVLKLSAAKTGSDAPEINLPSPNGSNIALSSLRGKVVLIDFWASWCGPCRKEMPNVKAAYAKYRSKGFEIYGVSLDKEKDAWLEAIAKDGLTWPQVSDLKFWDCEAAKLYNIQSIPATVLLDKEGKIIAKNLRGVELEKKLAEVLK